MLKKYPIIAGLVLLALLATGCTKVLVQVNPDGSGTWQYGLQIDLQTLESLGEPSAEPDPDNQFLNDLLAGGTFTDPETGVVVRGEQRLENGKRWIYTIADVTDISQWAGLVGVADRVGPQDNAPAEPGMTPEIDPGTEDLLYPVVTVDGNTVRVEISGPPPAELIEQDDFGLGALFTPSYEIDMPGTVTDTNGEIDSLTGNPILIVDPTSTEPIFFFAESEVE
ncbi:MAG: hypothetical protein ACLFTK_16435 [Anaerolineales bacterium]